MYYFIRNLCYIRDEMHGVYESKISMEKLVSTVQTIFASFLFSFDKQLLHKKLLSRITQI